MLGSPLESLLRACCENLQKAIVRGHVGESGEFTEDMLREFTDSLIEYRGHVGGYVSMYSS